MVGFGGGAGVGGGTGLKGSAGWLLGLRSGRRGGLCLGAMVGVAREEGTLEQVIQEGKRR